MNDKRTSSLFLGITIPEDFLPGESDPDVIADEVAKLLNKQRATHEAARSILDGTYDVENGSTPPDRIHISAIPSPQWLTKASLDNLVAAARGES